MGFGYITFFAVLICVTKVYLKECQPIVTVPEGSIIGKRFITNNKIAFNAFLDIPYAIPPVKKLRFQETRPIKKWDTPLDATENKKVCIQFDPTFDDPRATEDCLVLNVYVPEEEFCDRKKGPLPVLLWIHGGSFRSWFGTMDTFGPQYFINQNIIVVSMNYRLGPLGFLSTADDVIPGNLGIKDQQLAIKWISKRIKHFGGDPSRITLMGQSAGAISVGYHLMNPQNRGLFSGAIMQSGSPLSCAALQKFPRDAAFLMAAEIDERFKNITSSKELLRFLQETPLDVLKTASFVKMPTIKLNCQFVGSLTWVPTRESPEAKNPVITGMNYEKVKNGLALKVPLLIGINSQESAYYGMDGLDFLAKIYDINPSYLISGNLNINHKQRCAAGQALKYIYTNSSFSSDISKLIEFNSDTYFNVPTLTFAYYHAQHSDVYAYRFAFKGMIGNLNSTIPGVGHAEDLNYLFQNSENENLSKYPNDEVVTHNRLVELWSQFIKYRNPTKHTNDLLQKVNWPKFTQNKFVHLNIDENLSVGQFKSTFKEWINIISRFARPLIDTF